MRIEQRDVNNPEHSLSLSSSSTCMVEKCDKNLITVDNRSAIGGDAKCPITRKIVHIDSLGLCSKKDCPNQKLSQK